MVGEGLVVATLGKILLGMVLESLLEFLGEWIDIW